MCWRPLCPPFGGLNGLICFSFHFRKNTDFLAAAADGEATGSPLLIRSRCPPSRVVIVERGEDYFKKEIFFLEYFLVVCIRLKNPTTVTALQFL